MKQIQQVVLKWMLLFLLIPMSEIAIGQNPLFEVESTYLSKHGIVYQTSAFDGLEGFPVEMEKSESEIF